MASNWYINSPASRLRIQASTSTTLCHPVPFHAKSGPSPITFSVAWLRSLTLGECLRQKPASTDLRIRISAQAQSAAITSIRGMGPFHVTSLALLANKDHSCQHSYHCQIKQILNSHFHISASKLGDSAFQDSMSWVVQAPMQRKNSSDEMLKVAVMKCRRSLMRCRRSE